MGATFLCYRNGLSAAATQSMVRDIWRLNVDYERRMIAHSCRDHAIVSACLADEFDCRAAQMY
jgi:hypothetical protein